MTDRRLLLPLAVLLLLFLLATLPLRLALAGTGVAAGAATGSIWRGRLVAARWHGIALGDLDVGLELLPLLAGSRRLAFATGSLEGRIASARGRLAIDRLDGTLAGATLAGLPLAGVPLAGVRFGDVAADFDDGRCVGARGTVGIDLAGPLAALGTLAGTARCDGDRLLLPLRAGQARVDLRLAGDGRYTAAIAIDAVAADLQPVLRGAGFQPTPTGVARTIEGRL